MDVAWWQLWRGESGVKDRYVCSCAEYQTNVIQSTELMIASEAKREGQSGEDGIE